MYLIETPNRNFNGVRAGVRFKNGQARVKEKDVADYLKKNFGYKVKKLGGKKKKDNPAPPEQA